MEKKEPKNKTNGSRSGFIADCEASDEAILSWIAGAVKDKDVSSIVIKTVDKRSFVFTRKPTDRSTEATQIRLNI